MPAELERTRPVCWNLIVFAGIGAVFAIWAMYLVESADRHESALLYSGLIGAYAACIQELDLASMEIDKLRAAAVERHNDSPKEHARDQSAESGYYAPIHDAPVRCVYSTGDAADVGP